MRALVVWAGDGLAGAVLVARGVAREPICRLRAPALPALYRADPAALARVWQGTKEESLANRSLRGFFEYGAQKRTRTSTPLSAST